MARADILTVESSRTGFLIRALLWSTALFALMRVTWVEQTMIAALLDLQGTIVRWYVSTSGSITITPSCGATDAMSMCLGVVLGLSRDKLKCDGGSIGAIGGITIILAVNIVRIGTLAILVSKWPGAFESVHELVWPIVITLAIAAYVWWWIRRVANTSASPRQQAATNLAPASLQGRRFALTAGALLALQLFTAPWTMTSTAMNTVGHWTAETAHITLSGVGVPSTADKTLITTSRGTFQITPECLLTPVLPIYLAAVLSLPLGLRRRIGALLAAAPIFFGLAVVRVLVLALPPSAVASPIYFVHGFFQIVLALAIVAMLCRPVTEKLAASTILDWRRFGQSVAIGFVASIAGGQPLTMVTQALASALAPWFPHALTNMIVTGDPQGVLVLAPGYELGLLAAMWWALRPRPRVGRTFVALAGLIISLVILAVAAGAWLAHAGVLPHALILRAWTVVAPLGLAWLLFRAPETGELVDSPRYRRFWHSVGDEFPDLGGAASTDMYFEDECALISSTVPALDGCRIFKTDLWDEARNTRIMQWANRQGATVYGIDLSAPTVKMARVGFVTPPSFAVADVRRVPFADGSFDAIYSMGTVEHFDETQGAINELARVLRPGGRLILGVPNRYDPFLRPVLAWLMQRTGSYGYGFEKCYSRRALRQMLEAAGLTVGEETGILFIPGYLRMLDLACHAYCRPLTVLTAPMVRVFHWLTRRFPRLRRHGYLLASVGVKPPTPR